MNYLKVIENDLLNGRGVRTTLFVSGCEHECAGCYNQVSWDPEAGSEFTKETEDFIISTLKPSYVAGLSISGGDPLFEANISTLRRLVRRVSVECPDKDIWLWTGYKVEKLSERQITLASMVDYIVDGRYSKRRKCHDMPFRGSSNQRLINTKDILWYNHPIVKAFT